MAEVRRRSSIFVDLERTGAIKLAGAMYNLKTGLVEFLS